MSLDPSPHNFPYLCTLCNPWLIQLPKLEGIETLIPFEFEVETETPLSPLVNTWLCPAGYRRIVLKSLPQGGCLCVTNCTTPGRRGVSHAATLRWSSCPHAAPITGHSVLWLRRQNLRLCHDHWHRLLRQAQIARSLGLTQPRITHRLRHMALFLQQRPTRAEPCASSARTSSGQRQNA